MPCCLRSSSYWSTGTSRSARRHWRITSLRKTCPIRCARSSRGSHAHQPQESPMSLADLWFVLFILIISAYLVLDGFDLGVGILHPFVARTDGERRVVLNAIGPIWDGNEVWLVVGGGVLFAAFPIVYAALFSGFYGAIMLVLLCLITRTVAIEFRSKMTSPGWRAVWDYVFFGSSLGLAVLLGVALGNIARGIPLNQAGEVEVANIFDLLNPFALLVGLTSIAMVTLHGAMYLNLKTE